MEQRSPVHETSEETQAGAVKTDIAVTPLGVPLLAGPGAISTVILMQTQAGGDLWKNVALCGCVIIVSLATYIILRMAAHGAKWLGEKRKGLAADEVGEEFGDFWLVMRGQGVQCGGAQKFVLRGGLFEHQRETFLMLSQACDGGGFDFG